MGGKHVCGHGILVANMGKCEGELMGNRRISRADETTGCP